MAFNSHEFIGMGLGGRKNALFINYSLQYNKVKLGFETLVKGVIFFFPECYTKTGFLTSDKYKTKKGMVGIRNGRVSTT